MNDLTDRLAREADEFERRGGTALHLDQVLDRAGEIRRGRRLRATLVMAAVVVAVAAPAALLATHRDVSPEPTPAAPTKADTSPVTLGGLDRGHNPSAGWMQGKVWHGPDGSGFTWTGGRVLAVALAGDGTLVASSGDQGQRAYLVPPVGSTAHQMSSWPMEGGFAVSADGKEASFVAPDGTPMVIQGGSAHPLPRVPEGSGFDGVAVTGKTCLSPAASVCAVWVRTNGRSPASWVSTPEGVTPVQAAAPMWRLSDVLDDGTQAGMTDVSDSGSCSRVQSGTGTALWSTCEYRLLSFSPDGRHLLASSAYADGAGDNRLAVLDAASGEPVLDLRTAQDAFAGQVVWEDDTHVLAAVAEGGRWAVLRIGLDGHREYAVAPVTGKDPYVSPFVLPSR